ncbi:Collectin-12 [Halotydeus destructor]|nr:Collectin-12 [Halotydeus destructor]
MKYVLIVALSFNLCFQNVLSVPEYVGTRFDKKYYINTEKTNFKQAKTSCELIGGRLVKISNQIEQDYIHAMLESRESYWLGAVNKAGTLHFTWLDGTSLSYERWYTNQPNEAEQCSGVFYYEADGMWYDAACAYKLKSLCEIEMTIAQAMTTEKPSLGYHDSQKIFETIVNNMTSSNTTNLVHFFRWTSATLSITNDMVDKNAIKLDKVLKMAEDGQAELIRKTEGIVKAQLNETSHAVSKMADGQSSVLYDLANLKMATETLNYSISDLEDTITDTVRGFDDSISKLALMIVEVNQTVTRRNLELQKYVTDLLKETEDRIKATTKEIVFAMDKNMQNLVKSLSDAILLSVRSKEGKPCEVETRAEDAVPRNAGS